MFSKQTNPPEFDPAHEAGSASVQDAGAAKKPAPASAQFETLDAFADWLDVQLELLEETYEGFETATSVRGFFGR